MATSTHELDVVDITSVDRHDRDGYLRVDWDLLRAVAPVHVCQAPVQDVSSSRARIRARWTNRLAAPECRSFRPCPNGLCGGVCVSVNTAAGSSATWWVTCTLNSCPIPARSRPSVHLSCTSEWARESPSIRNTF